MRLARWEQWVREVLAESPAITEVASFAEAGITHKPCGHVVTLSTGAQVYVQWVRTAATVVDDDHSKPEQEITGAPPELVPEVELPVSGRVQVRQIEQHLVTLITNAKNAEVRGVTGKSSSPDSASGPRPCGVAVHFHSGASVFGNFLHTLPAGSAPQTSGEFQQRKEI